MPSIRVLKTFLAVAQHGTFAAAAEHVGLTSAAVALQMRALEQDLNQTLFDRTGRSVVLNTAGRLAVVTVGDLVARYEELASRGEHGLAGTVFVGALVSSLVGAFGRALGTLQRRHPRLDVKLFSGMSDDFAARVERGELDVAVITRPPRPLPKGLRWTALYTEPMVLIAPRRRQHPVPADPLEALRTAPFLRFDRNTWTGSLVEQVLAKAGASPRESLQLNSVDAIAALVRQGFGVAVVPLLDVRWKQDPDLRVHALPGVRVVRQVGLLERAVHARRQFVDAIKDEFRTQ